MIIDNKYEILTSTELNTAQVTINYDPRERTILTQRQREEIQLVCEKLKESGRVINPLPLYRFLSYSLTEAGITLNLGLTNYTEYIGTNISHPEWLHVYGEDTMSNALAMSGSTETSDGKIIVEKRSNEVGEYPGYYHCIPSGHLHPEDTPLTGITRELYEELGITEKEIDEIVCTGLVLNLEYHKHELTFALKVSVNSEEISSRPKVDSWEAASIEFLPKDAHILKVWLIEHLSLCAPPGHASLLLAGKRSFGQNWFTDVISSMGHYRGES
jgi:8-oxo-dGTP pyrophosphatase MutT (NUDIX family)